MEEIKVIKHFEDIRERIELAEIKIILSQLGKSSNYCNFKNTCDEL